MEDSGAALLEYHGTPGYHGELYLDPASGAIERVTLEAELGETEVVRKAAISVEYGPVDIGGTTYICPARSVAISQDMNRPGKTIGGAMPVTRINETRFTGYHRFGSTCAFWRGRRRICRLRVRRMPVRRRSACDKRGPISERAEAATAAVENAAPSDSAECKPYDGDDGNKDGCYGAENTNTAESAKPAPAPAPRCRRKPRPTRR